MVGAEALQRHYADLEEAALNLLEVLMPPSLIGKMAPSSRRRDIQYIADITAMAFKPFEVQVSQIHPHAEGRAARLRGQVAVQGLKEHLCEEPSRWELVERLEKAHQDYYDAWQNAQQIYNEDTEGVVKDLRSVSPGQAGGVTEELTSVISYLEYMEELFAELETILSPTQLRSTLLATRCQHCPLP